MGGIIVSGWMRQNHVIDSVLNLATMTVSIEELFYDT